MNFKKWILTIIVVILFPLAAWAIPAIPTIPSFPSIQSNGTTFYVDKDIGKDTRSKAEAQNPSTPWNTISHGVSQMSAGDTLIVGEGATPYYEEVDISLLGNSNAWFTIKGADGERPVISGTTGTTYGFEIHTSAKYVYIKGFKIQGQQNHYSAIRIRSGGSMNIVLDDVIVDATGTSYGIFVGTNLDATGIRDCHFRNVTVSNSNGHGWGIFNRAENLTFDSCQATNNGNDGFAGRANWWETGYPMSNIYFKDCVSSGNTNEGFDIGSDNDFIFKNCKSYGNKNGFKVWCAITNNHNTWLVNCLSYENTLYGLSIKNQASSNIYLLNCTFAESNAPYAIIVKKGNDYNEQGYGWREMQPLDIYMYDNILMSGSDCIFRAEDVENDVEIKEADNNYFYSKNYNSNNAKAYRFDIAFSEQDNIKFNQLYSKINNWYPSGSDANSIYRTMPDSGLFNPGFVDEANDDYSLSSDSLAINSGRSGIGVTDDINGLPRPQGTAVDIGAYEYVDESMTSISAPRNLSIK